MQRKVTLEELVQYLETDGSGNENRTEHE